MQDYIEQPDVTQDAAPYYLYDFTPEERAFIELYEAWSVMPDGDDKDALSRNMIQRGQLLGVFPRAVGDHA